jgi:hypothetical protein
MGSNGFRNLCQDFAEGLVSVEGTELSVEERSTLMNNLTSVIAETRQALTNIHAAGASNMAQGGANLAQGGTSAAMGTSGSGPISNRSHHVQDLYRGGPNTDLNRNAHLVSRSNSRALFSEYLGGIPASGIGTVQNFLRGNSPPELHFRNMARSSVTPFLNDIVRMGDRNVTLPNGEIRTMNQLARDFKNLTPELKEFAKREILQNMSAIFGIPRDPRGVHMRETLSEL